MIGIKSKKIIIGIILLATLLLTCCASVQAANRAEIEFEGEPTYNLTQKIKRQNNVIGYSYDIIVKIKNNGDITSEKIVVNLTDEEGFDLAKTVQIDPGETEIVTFSWSTLSDKDQSIIIRYFPENLDAIHNKYNTGSTIMKMIIGGKDSVKAASTPGFEILILFVAISIYLISRKKKN